MKRKISFVCIFLLVLSMVMPVNSLAYTYEEELAFPACGQEEGEQISVVTLNGDNMSVSFRSIKASDGKNYIQRETTVSGNKVDSYTDGLGFLIMYASSTSSFSWPVNGSNENYPHFYGSYNGYNFNTANVFAGGYPSWVTMSNMTAGNNQVTMTGENEFAKVEAVWSVAPAEKDPKVELSITAKKAGYYSFGMFASPKSIAKTDMKFIQVPFRYNEKGLPDDCYLVSEAYSTASVSQVTTNTGTIIPGKDVTYGIYVDSKSVVSEGNTSASKPRWVKSNSELWYINDSFASERVDISDDESNFGMSIRAKDGGVQPGAFAPIMGTSDSKFSQDGVYKITYRPLATVSEPSISSWYDTYERVLSDYLKVRDYRDNYYASMTDTIFNMTDLAMDDFYGGWSDEGKAHYNMEGRNIVSNADPLSYLQLYLLTEDKDILNERTIPSMEFILSRSSAMYNAYGQMDGTGTIHGYGSPLHMTNALIANSDTLSSGYTAMGFKSGKEGTEGIGNSTYFGAYQMTMGMMPYFHHLSAVRLNPTYVSKANYAGVNNPSEHLWRSKALQMGLSGSSESAATILNRAKIHGGWYLDRRVNLNYQDDKIEAGANDAPDDQLFIFKDFVPNIHCLLELYEETGEQKYLDGAEESAKRLIATLWATYMPEDGEIYEIDEERADYLRRVSKRNTANEMWWHGDTRFRLGEAEDAWKSSVGYISKWNSTAKQQQETTVPAWTVSRVGLGLEQTTTFGATSGNIIMSTWAPDLMRIAYLTGNEMLETFARNSIVGRYANYPSYYLTEYTTFQQQKNFPYEGPDVNQIYYHHIPVMISMLQDFLISQSYSWSDGAVDFPSVRSQGYHYYSNRHYGFAPGDIFSEHDMWLWMKKGLLTVDNKQIDWFGARKDGRVAFVLTNASDEEITTTLTFGDEVKMNSAVNSVIYTAGAGYTTKVINNKTTTVKVPPKTTVAIAFNANVSAPDYSRMYGTNLTDYSESHATATVKTEGDVTGNVVQIAPDSYTAYVYTPYRPASVDAENGISMAILRYSVGGSTWQAITDTTFPFEFSVPVASSSDNFQYKVELYDKDASKIGITDTQTLKAQQIVQETPVILTSSGTRGTTIKVGSNPTISGWNTANNSSIVNTGNCFAFFKMGNDTGKDVNVTALFVIVDADGGFKRVAKIVSKTIPASNTSSSMLNFSTNTNDPIVLTDEDLGGHFVVYVWKSLDSMKPYMKYDFKTGKSE